MTLSPGVNFCRGGDFSNNMSLPDIVMDAGMMVTPATSIKLQQEFGPTKEEKEVEMMEVVCVGSSRGDGLSSDSGLTLSQGFERFATGGSTPSPVSEMHNPTNLFSYARSNVFSCAISKVLSCARSKLNKSCLRCARRLLGVFLFRLDMLADMIGCAVSTTL